MRSVTAIITTLTATTMQIAIQVAAADELALSDDKLAQVLRGRIAGDFRMYCRPAPVSDAPRYTLHCIDDAYAKSALSAAYATAVDRRATVRVGLTMCLLAGF